VLESPNLLTSWRINRLVGADASAEAPVSFTLDAPIDPGTVVAVRFKKADDGVNTDVEIFNHKDEVADENGETNLYHGEKIVGKVNFGKGKITMYCSSSPLIEGESNIEVQFSHRVDGHRGAIEQCQIGALFGANGNSDHLFLSGNETCRNTYFWSRAEDFTYFPDGQQAYIGSEQSAIKSLLRLSDATLAIFKESVFGEPTAYYMTGTGENQQMADGQFVKMSVFTATAGGVGESAVSHFASANLMGDPLILSVNGVFGIELSQNISSSERYTKERSRAIYERLRLHDLADAVSTVFDGRYLLAVDGCCYVADSRYHATFEGGTSKNYEWWVWDNIPARAFAVKGKDLYFGTADGMLCVFDDVYADRTYTDIEAGDLQISSGGLSYNKALSPKVGDRVLLSGELYALAVASCTALDGGWIQAEEKDLDVLYEGMEVYVDRVSGGDACVDKAYLVADIGADITHGIIRYRLMDEATGSSLQDLVSGMRLCRKVAGQELRVSQVDQKKQIFFVEHTAGINAELILYKDESTDLVGRFIGYTPVVAEWSTPVMCHGTNMAGKTLLGITVTTDPNTAGNVTVEYETRKTLRNVDVQGTRGLDFNDIDFNRFTFESRFATSFTKRLCLRNFNYIRHLCRKRLYRLGQIFRGFDCRRLFLYYRCPRQLCNPYSLPFNLGN
jgi:hypothetical protein